jgi:tryptophan-rich sensory protein/methanogenic corrinoid protein MtbC1
VSESSVRRWADDGKIKISRTAGGHRKITRNEALRFIRATAANVVRPELLDLAEQPQLPRNVEKSVAVDRLTKALERGDRDVVIGLITGLYVDGTTAAEICDEAVRPAMQRIGERWPEDRRSILLEHRATSLCIDALIQLRASFATVSTSAVAIGGAPENDPYILPSLMAATVLADVGYQAVNLGANTPLDVIADSAEEMGALFVWVAMTSPLKLSTGQSLARLTKRLARRDIQLQLVGLLFASLVMLAMGGWLTSLGLGPWYDALEIPPWQPPGWVFTPVWIIVLTLLAIATWLAIPSQRISHSTLMIIYTKQFFLNIAWSLLFFALQSPTADLVDIIALDVVVLTLNILCFRASIVAGLLVVPYTVWLGFATAINVWIVLNN